MMDVVSLLCGLIIVCGSLGAINRYFSFKLHKNSYPWTLSTLVLNMFILLSTAYLLPLDIFTTSVDNKSKGSLPINGTMPDSGPTALGMPLYAHNFKYTWIFIYWLEFLLCWLVIPVLISYVSLKYALPRGQIRHRLSKAVMQNLRFYSICLVAVVIGMIYLVVSTGHGLTDFKPLLISLAHLYSLSYTLILLATGLIMFPKDIMDAVRCPTQESKDRLYIKLSKTHDDLNDSQLGMMENAQTLLNTNSLDSDDFSLRENIDRCKLEVQTILSELRLSDSARVPPLPDLAPQENNINTLDTLNQYYNKFTTQYYSYTYNKNEYSNTIKAISYSGSNTTLKTITSMIFGYACWILSCLIIFLEVFPTKWAHGWIFLGISWYNFGLELLILVYNTVISLYAMSKFKFQDFHLIPNGQSSPSNALYYSLYSSRLLFPLCFNLMVLVPKSQDGHSKPSSFETTLYHDLSLIPLVDFLNKFLPIAFVILIPLSYKYDLKHKVLIKILGEEYYYQFFGMMMYEPIGDQTTSQVTQSHTTHPSMDNRRANMDADYTYYLQDGKYLYERAMNNTNEFS